jgi:hypothetical protein
VPARTAKGDFPGSPHGRWLQPPARLDQAGGRGPGGTRAEGQSMEVRDRRASGPFATADGMRWTLELGEATSIALTAWLSWRRTEVMA